MLLVFFLERNERFDRQTAERRWTLMNGQFYYLVFGSRSCYLPSSLIVGCFRPQGVCSDRCTSDVGEILTCDDTLI